MISENKLKADNIIAVQDEVRTRILESLDVLDIDESAERGSQQKRLDEAVKQLNQLYQAELKVALSAYTGVASAAGQPVNDLSFCSYSPSEGIQDCPISSAEGRRSKQGTNEIIVVVHNPSMYNQSLVRIKLESQDYKAKIWNREG